MEQGEKGYLRINDLEFYIPPTSIQTSEHAVNLQYEPLRRATAIKIKSGRSYLQFVLTMVFTEAKYTPDGQFTQGDSYFQLAALIHQIRKCPFVSIENEVIRLAVQHEEPIACTVSSIGVQSGASTGMPEAIIATVQLKYFNYSPFSDRFRYAGAFSESALQAIKKIYEKGPADFAEFAKPHTLSNLYNRTAIKPLTKPWLKDRFDLNSPKTDPYITGKYGTPFEEYMYGGPSGNTLTSRFITDLADGLIIKYYDWKAPKTPPPPGIGVEDKKAAEVLSSLVQINSNILTRSSMCSHYQFHKEYVDRLYGAASAWAASHSGKTISINSAFRTYQEQVETARRNPNAARGVSNHQLGIAIDVQLRWRVFWKKAGTTDGVTHSGLDKSPDPLISGLDKDQWGKLKGTKTRKDLEVIANYSIVKSQGLAVYETEEFKFVNAGGGLDPREWVDFWDACERNQMKGIISCYGVGDSWHFQADPADRAKLTSQAIVNTEEPAMVSEPPGSDKKNYLLKGEAFRHFVEEAQTYDFTDVLDLAAGIVGKSTEEILNSSWQDMEISKDSADMLVELYQKAFNKWAKKELKDEDGDWEEVRVVQSNFGIMFRQPKEFVIEEGNRDLIIQSISASLTHNIVDIPLLGHQYPTAQYLGSQSMAGSVIFYADGDAGRTKLGELIKIFKKQQQMALSERAITARNPVVVENALLTLLGMDKTILDDIQTQTVDQMPDTLAATLTFSESDYSGEEENITYYYWKNDFSIQKDFFKWLIEKGDIRFSTGVGIEEISNTESDIEVLKTSSTTQTFSKLVFYYKKTEDAVINHLIQSFIGTLNQAAPPRIPYDKWEILNQIKALDDSGSLADYIRANGEPPTELLTGPNFGHLTLDWGLEIKSFYQSIAFQFITWHSDPNLKEMFRKYSTIGKVIGSPCYPDLDLPPNPITGEVRDTNPDFFFYNMSDCEIEANGKAWSSWIDLSSRFMEKSYNNFRKKIFRQGGGPYFFSDEVYQVKSPRLSPDPWDGIELDMPNPSVRTDAMGADTTDVKAVAEKVEKNFPFTKGEAPTFTNKAAPDPDRFKKMEAAMISLSKAGGEMDAVLDEVEKAKRGKLNLQMPEAGTVLNHQFGLNQFKELLQTDFKKNFYFNKLSMRRAYPTFKLFLIDEDTPYSEIGTRFTDDFYSVNSINSIMIVRSREIAADLAIIEVTNVDGRFTHRMYEYGWLKLKKPYSSIPGPKVEDTPSENDIANLEIKDGTKIQIRLGYSNCADELEVVFNGQIVSIEGSDIITLTCQSYATELVSHPKGMDDQKNFWFNADTDEILSTYICSPECKHFGRYEEVPQLAFLRYYKFRADGKPRWVYAWKKETSDDNIFAAPVRSYYNVYWGIFGSVFWGDGSFTQNAGNLITSSLVAGLAASAFPILGVEYLASKAFGGFLDYLPANITVWEIFKEMELRHPGWIASAVPYDDRMTMFFGVPSMKYFYREPHSSKEIGLSSILSEMRAFGIRITNPGAGILRLGAENLLTSQDQRFESMMMSKGTQILKDALSGDGINDSTRAMAQTVLDEFQDKVVLARTGLMQGNKPTVGEAMLSYRTRPFRNYHFVTSEHDIIANNIRADHRGTANAIRVMYNTKKAGANRSANLGLDMQKTEGENILIKLDDTLPEELIREKVVMEPNAQGRDMGRRYGIGHLYRETKEYYKGEMVILGDPKIKPYDVIYMIDTYNDIVGPIEVRKVTHIFRRETGFITEIVPDLCCTINEASTMLMDDAFGQICSQLWADYLQPTLGVYSTAKAGAVGVGASIGAGYLSWLVMPPTGLAMIAGSVALSLAGGIKIVRMLQGRYPIIVTPLLKHGKPYITGMQAYEIDGLVSNVMAEWKQWNEDVKEGAKFWGMGYRYVQNNLGRYLSSM